MGSFSIVLIAVTVGLFILRWSLRHHKVGRVILTASMTIMVLFAAANIIIEPQRVAFLDKAYETSLKDDLRRLRTAADDFYATKKRYPADLEELDGYLKAKGNNTGLVITTEGAVIEYSLVSGNGYAVWAYRSGGNRVYVMTSGGKDIRYRLKSEKDDALRSVE